MKKISAIDLFCGAGGLSHGFIKSNINVIAGFDIEESCRYAYEENNTGAKFLISAFIALVGKYMFLIKQKSNMS